MGFATAKGVAVGVRAALGFNVTKGVAGRGLLLGLRPITPSHTVAAKPPPRALPAGRGKDFTLHSHFFNEICAKTA